MLSHLGSGAEIMLSTISEAAGITVAPAQNQEVWDRWNSASPEEQASGFLEHDERLVAALENTSAEQRQSAMVELGFLPEPVHLVTPVAMRLSEISAHGWDVAVAIDPDAAIDAEAAGLLLEHFSGGLAFLLGFAGKADRLSTDAVVAVGDYHLVVDGSVRIVTGSDAVATATFNGPPEAAVRLLSGRLGPKHTPADVEVSGNVTLDDLRQVFPGY